MNSTAGFGHWKNPDDNTRARAELAKLGVVLGDDADESTEGLLHDRAEVRRGINLLQARALTLVEHGKQSEAEAVLRVIETCGSMVHRLNALLDCEAIATTKGGGRAAPQRNGNDALVLAPTDRFASLGGRSASPMGRFGFGDFIKALVVPSSDPGIRAELSENTDSTGGATVPTHLLYQLIDAMRAQTVVVRAGARTVPLETLKTSMARVASDPTANWRLENSPINVSDPTFEKVEFVAKSLAVLVKVPRELMEDAVNLNEALMGSFAGAMAVEVDRVALFGSGTNPEPRGLFTTTGVSSVEMAANGAALANWGKVLDTLLELQNANAPEPTAMVMAPRTWRTIAGFVDTTNQPLRAPEAIAPIPRMTTKNVPINQVQGSASNASCIVIGDFSQLMLGVRTALRVEVLRERYAENHQLAFVAHLRMDVQVAKPKAFAILKGIIP